MKQVFKIDNEGFYIEDVILEDDDIIPIGCIEVECPDGFYRPKWNGRIWIEGLTKDEIEELRKPKPQPPSEMDLLKEEVLQQSEAMVDMDFRLTSLELGL